MEEAIVEVALDLNQPPPEKSSQPEAQQDRRSDRRDQTPFLAPVSQVEHVSSPVWSQAQLSSCPSERSLELDSSWSHERAARVEALRQCVASGTYVIDSAELAGCILRNSTRFAETR